MKVSESAFSFLFSEFLSYQKRRVASSTELEQKYHYSLLRCDGIELIIVALISAINYWSFCIRKESPERDLQS